MSTLTQRLKSPVTGPLVTPTFRDRRDSDRVELMMPVFIRRPSNSPEFRKEVETRNVSRDGARLILDIPLEIDAELLIYAFGDQFSAKVVVRHVVKQKDGSWAVGVQFLEKHGKWIIV